MAGRRGRVHGPGTRTDGERVGDDETKAKKGCGESVRAMGFSIWLKSSMLWRAGRPRPAERARRPSLHRMTYATKRKRPDSVLSPGTLVEQPSPEVCSRTTLRSDRRAHNGTNGGFL